MIITLEQTLDETFKEYKFLVRRTFVDSIYIYINLKSEPFLELNSALLNNIDHIIFLVRLYLL